MENINLDVDYFTHPKTVRLIGLLGRGSEVLPIRLWCWCAKYHAESGLLAGYSTDEIESVVQWWGEKGRFVEAMLKVGLMEQNEAGICYLHDFLERNGHIAAFKMRAKKGAEERWRRVRETKADKTTANDATSIASSMPQALLQASPSNAPPTHLPTYPQKQQIPRATESPPPQPENGECHDFSWLEQYLLGQWGREGRLGYLPLQELVTLGKTCGRDRLEYAIQQAAEHNKRSVAYVKGILQPKAKPGEIRSKLRRCDEGHEWDPTGGQSICPICYADVYAREKQEAIVTKLSGSAG